MNSGSTTKNYHQIRLIVTDMDETLLTSDKIVSPYTMEVLDEIRQKGILFSICTGRIQPMTVAYARMLKLQSPYITANGALIWDPVAEKALWGEPIEAADVRIMAEFCERNGIDYGVLTMGTSYFSKGGETRKRFNVYNRIAAEQGLPEMDLAQADDGLKCLEGIDTYKFLIWDETLEHIPVAEAFLNTLDGIGFTHSQKGLIDIMHKGIDKGTGVAELAKLLGVKKDEICVFGDYLNDISMFREAGYSVAMANGAPEVKGSAGYITRSNNEDGVAYAIKSIFGLC